MICVIHPKSYSRSWLYDIEQTISLLSNSLNLLFYVLSSTQQQLKTLQILSMLLYLHCIWSFLVPSVTIPKPSKVFVGWLDERIDGCVTGVLYTVGIWSIFVVKGYLRSRMQLNSSKLELAYWPSQFRSQWQKSFCCNNWGIQMHCKNIILIDTY